MGFYSSADSATEFVELRLKYDLIIKKN